MAQDANADGFESILFPIGLVGQQVPGAYGTVWTGAIYMQNNSGDSVGLVRSFVGLTGFGVYGPGYLGPIGELGVRPDLGLLLTPFTHEASQITFSNRIWETTRAAQPRGVEIPVVRERDFFRGPQAFLGVPSGPNVRIALRVYDPRIHDTPARQQISAVVLNPNGNVLGEFELSPERVVPERNQVTQPGFAAVNDVAALVPAVLQHDTIHIRVRTLTGGEYWAMVSVTDNATQTVSIVTAQ